MEPLRKMAALAATERIRGRSLKRNSLLKPLDIILDNLEREPKKDFRDLVRSASERQIFDHIDAITEPQYKPGKVKRERKQDIIHTYVDLFFDDILQQIHQDDVYRLLQRSKFIRSAYLTYYRNAIASEQEKERLDQEQAQEAEQTSSDTDE